MDAGIIHYSEPVGSKVTEAINECDNCESTRVRTLTHRVLAGRNDTGRRVDLSYCDVCGLFRVEN